MDPANRSRSVRPSGICRRPHGVAGFTLVEVALASMVLVVAILALFGTMVASYRMTAKTRARDQARAILQSYVDQFLRGSIPGQLFFQTCSAQPWSLAQPGTGKGLTWNLGTTHLTQATDAPLEIPLGGSGDVSADALKLNVKTWRWVSELDEDTGVINTSLVDDSIGRMLFVTFTAQYTVNKQTETISLTLARSSAN